MSYQEALEAAGANVLAFEKFGSYQGDWAALVEHGGQRGWVIGSFGSCSYCDPLEGEVGYDASEEKLAEFGAGYLIKLMTQEEAEKEADGRDRWEPGILEFVRANGKSK